ncbi:MAG: hypothetical protein NTX17_07550 [Candidatus Eisenbacteria bacterium]|nr:hypothetical protein [Candidatus Eisenbacteria bacterium]
MQIISGATFGHYVKRLAESSSLTAGEKLDLNGRLRPLCRESISLLRSAYKSDPANPDINAQLVRLLCLDYKRIDLVGLRSEKLQALQTGFSGDDGHNVSGYPAMIEYHATRCRENDLAGKYSKMLDDLLGRLME